MGIIKRKLAFWSIEKKKNDGSSLVPHRSVAAAIHTMQRALLSLAHLKHTHTPHVRYTRLVMDRVSLALLVCRVDGRSDATLRAFTNFFYIRRAKFLTYIYIYIVYPLTTFILDKRSEKSLCCDYIYIYTRLRTIYTSQAAQLYCSDLRLIIDIPFRYAVYIYI